MSKDANATIAMVSLNDILDGARMMFWVNRHLFPIKAAVNDTAKKKSVLGIITFVLALVIGLCFLIFKGIAVMTHDDEAVFVWALPTLVAAPIGIIVGAISLFKNRSWFGLVGVALNILFLAIAGFIVLEGVLREIVKGMTAVH